MSSLIDPKTKIGAYYHKHKYVPIDRLLDYYNDLEDLKSKEQKPERIAEFDREINAVKEIFKETAHE